MINVFQWFLFGMFVWCCVVCMSAVAHRLAPEMGQGREKRRQRGRHFWRNQENTQDAVIEDDPRDLEIRDLRKRIETLEAVITDRRYQWDEEFRRRS